MYKIPQDLIDAAKALRDAEPSLTVAESIEICQRQYSIGRDAARVDVLESVNADFQRVAQIINCVFSRNADEEHPEGEHFPKDVQDEIERQLEEQPASSPSKANDADAPAERQLSKGEQRRLQRQAEKEVRRKQ